MLKGTWLEPALWWVYASIAVTGLCGLIYAGVQQNYRQSLNDPQIQIAEDAAARLAAGGVPADIVPHDTPLVDLRNSLSPWIAVYDSAGVPLEASGQLDGAPPKLPMGVFDTSKWWARIMGHHFNNAPHNESWFSWQPDPSLRQAVVLVYVPSKNEYVAAGRNMLEVENRIEGLAFTVLVGWFVIEGALFVSSFIGWWLLKK
jgi:hypothetical protein